MKEDENEIRKLVDDWMTATRAGDRETVLDLIADDALFLTAAGPPFGKMDFAGAPDQGNTPKIDGKNEILEMEIMGNRAWTRNAIEIVMTPPGGEPQKMSGQTLTLFRKEEDGKWRLFRDANFVKPSE